MKTKIQFLILVFVAALWGCEKNDPLADQGELTGNSAPFSLLAQMPDAAAGDTIVLRNVAWAVDDNIETISFYHQGFKLQTFEVKLAIQTGGADEILYEWEFFLAPDTIIIPETEFAVYPEQGKTLNDYYQTLENAYVILHEFIVPQQYALTRERNRELILALDDEVFGYFANHVADSLNRRIFLAIFPEISPFNTTYFEFDSQGTPTGGLAPAGYLFYRDNITRDRFADFVTDATPTDNTRVTIKTAATLMENGAVATSRRTFRVL